MRVLITGLAGFAGSHLAEELLAQGWEVWGTVHSRKDRDLPKQVVGSCKLLTCNITEPGAVRDVLGEARPEVVFHLAAQSSVATSWEAVEETFRVNVMGGLALFEAVRSMAPRACLLVVSSSDVYGESLATGPATEETPLRPVTPYGASKASLDWLAHLYGRRFGLDVRLVRPFSHTGPRQRPAFAPASFARQIALIEAGLQEPCLRVGELALKRDYTDVRDMVRAYRLIVARGSPGGVYNACSGRVVSIGQILEELLSRSLASIQVVRDPVLLRPVEIPLMSGDASRLRRDTGWLPEIPWERTLDDLLSYWREKVKSES